ENENDKEGNISDISSDKLLELMGKLTKFCNWSKTMKAVRAFWKSLYLFRKNIKYLLPQRKTDGTLMEINFLLYSDDDQLSKSSRIKIWPISGMILNLPKKFDYYFFNKIFTGDILATSKLNNMKGIDGKNEKFANDDNKFFELRSKDKYKKNLFELMAYNYKSYYGIQRKSYLLGVLKIPKAICIDSMHIAFASLMFMMVRLSTVLTEMDDNLNKEHSAKIIKSHLITHLKVKTQKHGNVTNYGYFSDKGLMHMLANLVSQVNEKNSLSQKKAHMMGFQMTSFVLMNKYENTYKKVVTVNNLLMNMCRSLNIDVNDCSFLNGIFLNSYFIKCCYKKDTNVDGFLIYETNNSNFNDGLLFAVIISKKKIDGHFKIKIKYRKIDGYYFDEIIFNINYNELMVIDESKIYSKSV
uniref:Uncharacterized protein n=1 Tax=Strongyloides stercoralis TaxID=6248 RepID=A0AAF5DKT9_STRER